MTGERKDVRDGAIARGAVVFYDGSCGFCNRTVNFLAARDEGRKLYFAPLQGEVAKVLLYPELRERLDTLVLAIGEERLVRSTAVLTALSMTGGAWHPIAKLLLRIPGPLRDLVYVVVSGLRFRFLGARSSCRLPTPDERAQFLE